MWQELTDRSARGIATEIRRLVTNGELAQGTRLATVRSVAKELGVSPTTVSEAWQSLSRAGIVASHGRNGTVVLGIPDPILGPRRYRRVTQGGGKFALDLSHGTPDPALLPDLSAALTRAARRAATQAGTRAGPSMTYVDSAVLPELHDVMVRRWPFVPGAVTVVDGAMDALDRITAVVVSRGDRVLVEACCFPPLLDLLEQSGAEVVGLPGDAEGILPQALVDALDANPVALFLQPRAHNPTGVSMTARRAEQLGAVLQHTKLIVIEDDHSGDIACAPVVSLGTALPDRVVHILGFSKSHGPDLRLAAIGGNAPIVHAVATRRMLGPGWSSRLLQGVLTDLLTHEASIAAVADARAAYAIRREAVVAILRSEGIDASGDDGINVWIAVERENDALLALAARGIGASPGSPFTVGEHTTDHIRVTVAELPATAAEIAPIVAEIVAALRADNSQSWQRPS